MATKSSTKTKTAKKATSKKTTQKHDLLYIMSESCGWCKKANPVVEELVKDGHKITTLDVMNPDEGKRANEVKQKFNAQCGTPLFLDAETGNSVCGFREKDVLEKWAKGEEIPAPPRPKTPPPPPPQNLDDDTEVNTWKERYEVWCKENDHMPKLLPADDVLARMKQARAAQANAPQGAPGAPMPGGPGAANAGSGNIEHQHTFNNEFYYVVVNGNKEAVKADSQYIQTLKQQYFQRETDGRLTKVVSDPAWNTPNPNAPAGGNQNVAARQAPTPQNKPVSDAVKKQLDAAKKASKNQKEKTAAKSKENKKTIERF